MPIFEVIVAIADSDGGCEQLFPARIAVVAVLECDNNTDSLAPVASDQSRPQAFLRAVPRMNLEC